MKGEELIEQLDKNGGKYQKMVNGTTIIGRNNNSTTTTSINAVPGDGTIKLKVGPNQVVWVQFTIGPHPTFRYLNGVNRTSVLFVSVSFLMLMVLSVSWLVFYYVQRFRYIHAKDIYAVRNGW